MIEGESGQHYLTAWYRKNSSQYGATLEDMIIHNDETWNMYIGRTLKDVTERLGDNGFVTACYLLQYERDGLISKESVVSLFSEVLGL